MSTHRNIIKVNFIQLIFLNMHNLHLPHVSLVHHFVPSISHVHVLHPSPLGMFLVPIGYLIPLMTQATTNRVYLNFKGVKLTITLPVVKGNRLRQIFFFRIINITYQYNIDIIEIKERL